MTLGNQSRIGDMEVPVVHLELVRDYSVPFKRTFLTAECVDVLHAMLDKSPVEQFVCLHVSSAGDMVGAEKIAIGDLETVHVSLKNLFRGVILSGTPSFVIGHNHPSGSTEPSDQDLILTGLVVETAQILGLRFIDHIIVSPQGDHFSMINNQEKLVRRMLSHKLSKMDDLLKNQVKDLFKI